MTLRIVVCLEVHVARHCKSAHFWCNTLQELTKKVPSSYELVAQRKGFNRYMTPRLRELVSEHKAALEAREKASGCILQVSLL